jgi:cytochrome c oxidase subunit 3
MQAREWGQLPFSVDDHAYASAFYALTGFHGLHVAGGLLAMVALLGRVQQGPSAHGPVEVVSYYWHLVDVVWLALFASVYLSS